MTKKQYFDLYGPGDDNYGRDKFSEEIKMDICVNCGKISIYPVDTHIDYRQNYVEGIGQFCIECFNKIYKK